MSKSRSPAPGKRASPSGGGRRGKEELAPLPALDSLNDGSCVYFIGGWSAHRNFSEAISTISSKVKPANEADEEPYLIAANNTAQRNAATIAEDESPNNAAEPDKTVVLVLPGVQNESTNNGISTAALTHGMVIQGLPPSAIKKSKEAFQMRTEKPVETHQEGEEDNEGQQAVEGEEEEEVPVRKPRYEVVLGDEDEEDENEGEEVEKPKPKEYRHAVAVDTEDMVIVEGALTLEGIRPIVVVEPEPVTAAMVATALGLPTQPATTASGKVKRKTEEEKQREAEMLRKLEEESAEAARAEGERLSSFAIPERWPTATITNLAFTGPVTIKRAHVRFNNCHFSQRFATTEQRQGDASTLVSVHQYCRVEFVNCTFVEPRGTALYGFPTSELFLDSCVFCGYALPTTPESAEQLALLPPSNIQTSLKETHNERPNSVGLHTDCVKLAMTHCHFEALGAGAVIRGRFRVTGRMGDATGSGEEAPTQSIPVGPNGEYLFEADEEGHIAIPRKTPLSVIAYNTFISNFGTSMTLASAARIAVKKCVFTEAEYYDLICTGDKCTPQVMHCQFGGKVRVDQGSRPLLFKNKLSVPLINKNEGDAPYMRPAY